VLSSDANRTIFCHTPNVCRPFFSVNLPEKNRLIFANVALVDDCVYHENGMDGGKCWMFAL